MTTCKKCNAPITGNFCSTCGHPAELRRIDKHYIFQEIGDFFGANKGFLFTVKNLLTNPGNSVRRFLKEDRYRFAKPIAFVIVTSLIYAFINHFFHIGIKEYSAQAETIEGTTTSLILNWMLIDYPGYSSIFTGLFMAFWIKLLFRKSDYNLFEVFILMCFVSGVSTLFMSVVTIFQGLTHVNVIQISNLLLIFYFIWAIGQFFDQNKASSYIKALLSYILGVFVLTFLVVFTGTLIDILKGNFPV